MVEPLKKKRDANQHVKNHLTYLGIHGKRPESIWIDEGKEFNNQDLHDWCWSKGIKIEMTAPDSSSQNGVAKWMNQTIVELGRTMLRARNIPLYLWDFAVIYAAYVWNRTHTQALKGTTPYQIWKGVKSDISHLCEFGAPVWILHQGEQHRHKLETRSHQNIFVGFEDGSKSVKYYKHKLRKILISQNYRFLTLADSLMPTETEGIEIDLLDNHHSEGEPDTTPDQDAKMDVDIPSARRKLHQDTKLDDMSISSTVRLNIKRKTGEDDQNSHFQDKEWRNIQKQVKIDYKQLHKRSEWFSDETEDVNVEVSIGNLIYNAFGDTPLGSDDPKTLREAKDSPEWPQWEKAVETELQQLEDMGVWKLENQPEDMIPIGNKWVLIWKYDREGKLIKYKARLVVKGCAQRPGFDFNETYAPVVRIETIHAILTLVPCKGFKVRQMDVKSVFLNGNMSERVYMCQPDGFNDGTGCICWLIKMIYGLRQAGQEWNKVYDEQMWKLGFEPLKSDPCVYMHCETVLRHTKPITRLLRAYKNQTTEIWGGKFILTRSPHTRL